MENCVRDLTAVCTGDDAEEVLSLRESTKNEFQYKQCLNADGTYIFEYIYNCVIYLNLGMRGMPQHTGCASSQASRGPPLTWKDAVGPW